MINSVAGIIMVNFLDNFFTIGDGSYFKLVRDVCYGDRKIHGFSFLNK